LRPPATVPVQKIQALPGGGRVARRLVRLADVRSEDRLARSLRRTKLFGKGTLPLYWSWGFNNFGDALSPLVIEHVSGATPVLAGRRECSKVLAIGSVIEFARANDVVWGAGALRPEPLSTPRGCRILAVRGPLTRKLIGADVETFGDPAILLPRIYRPPDSQRVDVVIVPHYEDLPHVPPDPSVPVVNVFHHWKSVVDAITSADVVVSSSLHGLIVAEAYGIPAVWAPIGDRLKGGSFKFEDYYLATGRPARPADWSAGLSEVVARAQPPPPLDVMPLIKAWRDAGLPTAARYVDA
jgi:pyruvyltransferase